ncbi:MAG: tetratricopeptide repeat protein, partial [Deltaproteobacteria bacterium]|nr:tetratricopeptide repeat protein [Deltaproteobacteria bacterium]
MRQQSGVMWVAVLLGAAPAELLAGESGFGDTAVVRGMEWLRQGEDARALAVLREVITPERQGEMWAEARFVAARAALALGNSDEALGFLAGLERELPEVADHVHALAARSLRQQGRWQEALARWEKLVAAHPTSPLAGEARYSIADAHFALGHEEAALAAYTRALREHCCYDRAVIARFNLALSHERLGNLEMAASTYSSIVHFMPTDAMAPQAEARWSVLVAAGSAPPAGVRTQLARIDRLIAARLHEEALLCVERLVAQGRASATSVLFRRAQIAHRQGDQEDAIAALESLAAGAGGRRLLEYQSWLARAYSAAGQFDRAIALYEDMARRHRSRMEGREALYKAAWLAYNARQHERAVRLFSDFVARYPSDGAADEVTWYLAWNTFRMGDVIEAAATLARLRHNYPHSQLVDRAHYWEGRFRELAGDVERAKASYQATLSLDPLGYYGVLAAQRLRQVESVHAPVAGVPVLIASLEITDDMAPRSPAEPFYDPTAGELPPAGVGRFVENDALPWGSAALDWQGADGRRAQRLIKLGLHEEAAHLAARLPERAGQDFRSVAYERARVLYALGDFAGAYRIASSAFKEQMHGGPLGGARRFYQIAYPDGYRPVVDAAAHEFKVSPLLVLAVMRQESGFRPQARSLASARGLMQIIPSTGQRIAEALGQ